MKKKIICISIVSMFLLTSLSVLPVTGMKLGLTRVSESSDNELPKNILLTMGKTWTVDDEKSHGGDFTKIQDAIDAASDNDIIEVYSGQYYECIEVDKQLTIEGIPHDLRFGIDIGKPRIGGKTGGDADIKQPLVIITADGVDISNMYIRPYYLTIIAPGVLFSAVSSGSISNCNIRANDWDQRGGIILQDSDGIVISDNTIVDGDKCGIEMYDSFQNTIKNNDITNNGNWGIYGEIADDNIICSNTITQNDRGGIYLLSSSNNQIGGSRKDKNIINDNENGFGIFLGKLSGSVRPSENNDISFNDIKNNICGVYTIAADKNTIYCNTIEVNNKWKSKGIYIEDGSCNSVCDNVIYDGDIDVLGNINIIRDNIIRNTGIEDDDGNIISSGISLGGEYYFCESNTISGNIVEGSGSQTRTGIYVYNSPYTIISNNKISEYSWGIYLDGCWKYPINVNNNTISDNEIQDVKYGITLSGWDDRFVNNQISSNEISRSEYGIYMYSYNGVITGNKIFENTISDSDNGIYIINEKENKIDDNKIYHNNLIDNTQNAFDDSINNIWYDETSNKGNYWDDYTGTDEDGDGIGDTSYGIEPHPLINKDKYPLMYPYGANRPPHKPSKPSGETSGKLGEEYTYTTSTTDPEENQIFYLWDWDDGTQSEWLGPYNSGDICEATHTWSEEKGFYQIRVKAKDIHDAESEWSDPLSISMPVIYEPEELTAVLEASPRIITKDNFIVTFDASGSGPKEGINKPRWIRWNVDNKPGWDDTRLLNPAGWVPFEENQDRTIDFYTDFFNNNDDNNNGNVDSVDDNTNVVNVMFTASGGSDTIISSGGSTGGLLSSIINGFFNTNVNSYTSTSTSSSPDDTVECVKRDEDETEKKAYDDSGDFTFTAKIQVNSNNRPLFGVILGQTDTASVEITVRNPTPIDPTPIDPVYPIDPVTPVEPIRILPEEPETPVAPTESIQLEVPNEPVNPATPIMLNPGNPTPDNPVDPVDSVDPIDPVYPTPVNPTDPVTIPAIVAEPEESIYNMEPKEPVTTVKSPAPVIPEEPIDPNPVNPVDSRPIIIDTDLTKKDIMPTDSVDDSKTIVVSSPSTSSISSVVSSTRSISILSGLSR